MYRKIKNIEGKQILSFKEMTDCHQLNTVQGKTMNSLMIWWDYSGSQCPHRPGPREMASWHTWSPPVFSLGFQARWVELVIIVFIILTQSRWRSPPPSLGTVKVSESRGKLSYINAVRRKRSCCWFSQPKQFRDTIFALEFYFSSHGDVRDLKNITVKKKKIKGDKGNE